jgi:hypothetical protein
MKNVMATGVIVAAMTFGSGASLFAHHSHAMFDMTQELTLTGTIRKVVYANPHVMLYLDVKQSNGESESWSVEMSSIDNEQRRGVYPNTLKAGDVVTVKLHPLRDGRKGGNYTTITTADGKTYE